MALFGPFVDKVTVATATFLNRIDTVQNQLLLANLGNFANDAAAAGGGVAVGQFYRNGSVIQIRVT